MSLPRFLDGPRFIAFLASEGIHRHHMSNSQKRRFYEWEQGARADIYTESTDRLITDHCLLAIIPDDCWSEDQRPAQRGPRSARNMLTTA